MAFLICTSWAGDRDRLSVCVRAGLVEEEYISSTVLCTNGVTPRKEVLEHDMVEQVRNADLVVVNPTHLAVALPRDPPVFEEIEPFLRPPWNQTGTGSAAPVTASGSRPLLRDVN